MPELELATTEDIFDELHKRFPSVGLVCFGSRPQLEDVLWTIGNSPDTMVGALARLQFMIMEGIDNVDSSEDFEG